VKRHRRRWKNSTRHRKNIHLEVSMKKSSKAKNHLKLIYGDKTNGGHKKSIGLITNKNHNDTKMGEVIAGFNRLSENGKITMRVLLDALLLTEESKIR
jgi:hypothetical protein